MGGVLGWPDCRMRAGVGCPAARTPTRSLPARGRERADQRRDPPRMTPAVLYGLVLLAALGHAGWNALVKNSADRLLTMAMIRVVGLTFGAVVVWFLPPLPREAWPILAASIVAHFFYWGLLLESHRLGDLSLVYPIARGLAPVLLAALAWFAIGEALSVEQVAAVALISGGIFALVLGRHGQWAAVGVAVLTAVSIGVYTFLGGLGVRVAESVLAYLAWQELLSCPIFLAFALWRRRGAVVPFLRTSGITGLGAGVVSVGGYGLYLVAMQSLPMAPVTALRESSALFGAVIGTVLLREPFGARRIAASALITLGIAVLVVMGR